MKKLFTALSAAFLANAHAEPAQCPSTEWRPAASIGALPDDVQLLLGRGNRGVGGIADAGEAFNASDAIAPGSLLPMSRFKSAALAEDCVTVIVERGGIAHYFEALVFRKEKLAWRLVGSRAPADEEMPQQKATP
jgi:hypothetical protein